MRSRYYVGLWRLGYFYFHKTALALREDALFGCDAAVKKTNTVYGQLCS